MAKSLEFQLSSQPANDANLRLTSWAHQVPLSRLVYHPSNSGNQLLPSVAEGISDGGIQPTDPLLVVHFDFCFGDTSRLVQP